MTPDHTPSTSPMPDPGSITVVPIGGDIDLNTSPYIAETIQHALESRPPVLVLDLTDVSFLSSTRLSVLIETEKQDRTAGFAFRLVASQRAVLHPMHITGLTTIFDIYPSVTEAASATTPHG